MFIIEGIIGAGKSTFLQQLQKKVPTVFIAPEPVHHWENQAYGQSLLSSFYQNAPRWAYTFELMTLMHRAHDYQLLQKNSVHNLFIERSLYSGYHCFAYNSYLQGFMSTLEWELYQRWIDFLIIQKYQPPRGFIYLRIDPLIAYERIKKRSRDAEQSVSLDYLHQVYKRHEEFLVDRRHLYTPINMIPVLIIDVNNDFENNEAMMNNLALQLFSFVETV